MICCLFSIFHSSISLDMFIIVIQLNSVFNEMVETHFFFQLLEMPIIAHQSRNIGHSIQFIANCSTEFKRKKSGAHTMETKDAERKGREHRV